MDTKYTLSILLQNEPGALVRVAGLFAARHVNIEMLTVFPTHNRTVSRLTLVLDVSEALLDQIVRQTGKLVDVLEVHRMSRHRDGQLVGQGY